MALDHNPEADAVSFYCRTSNSQQHLYATSRASLNCVLCKLVRTSTPHEYERSAVLFCAPFNQPDIQWYSFFSSWISNLHKHVELVWPPLQYESGNRSNLISRHHATFVGRSLKFYGNIVVQL